MLKISDSFKNQSGRSPLFTSVIWASEWEAFNYPNIKLADRVVYCHVYAFGGATGLSRKAIAQAVWGNGDYRTSAKRSLDRLKADGLVIEKNKLWIAQLPQVSHEGQGNQPCHLGQNRSHLILKDKSGPVSNDTNSDSIDTKQPSAPIEPLCQMTHSACQMTHVSNDTVGHLTQKGGSNDTVGVGQMTRFSSQMTHHKRIDKKERSKLASTHAKDLQKEVHAFAVPWKKFDLKSFDPAVIAQGAEWIRESYEFPVEDEHFKIYLQFAAHCEAWRTLRNGKRVRSPDGFIFTLIGNLLALEEESVEAKVRLACEEAAQDAAVREAEAEAKQKAESEAPPKVSEVESANSADNFQDWLASANPDYFQKFSEYKQALEPNYQNEIQNTIRKADETIARLTGTHAQYYKKQTLSKLHGLMLRIARETGRSYDQAA